MICADTRSSQILNDFRDSTMHWFLLSAVSFHSAVSSKLKQSQEKFVLIYKLWLPSYDHTVSNAPYVSL